MAVVVAGGLFSSHGAGPNLPLAVIPGLSRDPYSRLAGRANLPSAA